MENKTKIKTKPTELRQVIFFLDGTFNKCNAKTQ